MPTRAKRPCRQPGCPQLVDAGYCEAHRKPDYHPQYEARRGKTAERGYDGAWRRFRAWFLASPAHAVCEDCQRWPSVEVHHLIKLRENRSLRLVESNCRGLCKACHSARTARGE